MSAETRARMVQTAAVLFQRDGYHATSWRRLTDQAGTPWGSINHHFPGGKEELGVAALELGAEAIASLVDHAFATHADPAAAVRSCFDISAQLMRDGGYETACPVASVALEGGRESAALANAGRAAFTQWEAQLARYLRGAGIPSGRARTLGATILTLLEGALIRARVHGTVEPLTSAGAQAAALVDAGRPT